MSQKGIAWDVRRRPYDVWNEVRDVMAWTTDNKSDGVIGSVCTLPEYADKVEVRLTEIGAKPTNRRLVYWYGNTHSVTIEDIPESQ
jgi:hypothetical protein